ncbi:carbohydrate kinase family protein [Paenibacillus lignilyticus]|uniref:Carbohydrate kinase family protein n=1 Tax=Paenibacillus lignilyticus TaxID=1172615 RepID=A0ABS5C7D6_9BACL|nr:carbohydrate kinase family protein [Paenibacillus lignilyticus]MBP3961897.1 carbohydrate kinase family protein [Paenibacillus lignilyticus]
MKKYDAIVIGDANIDLVVAGCNELPKPGQEVLVQNMTIHVGGGAALFSLALAKLGLKIAFNGILGEDGFGHFVRDHLNQYGIDTSYIRSSSSNTGISIAINPEKDRSFITYMGSNAELSMGLLDLESVALARHVHLTGYRGRENHAEYMKVVRSIKALGVTTSIDVGWDDTGEWFSGIFELMSEVNVFFMNEVEAEHYTGCSGIMDIIAKLSAYSSHFIVKLGSTGAVATVNGQSQFRSGFQVPVVDTTGAGDSFNAGYIYGFLSGQKPEQCLLYGNACGALSVTQSGGSTGTPDRTAMEHFLFEKANCTTDIWESA